jgi:hypothetical protein
MIEMRIVPWDWEKLPVFGNTRSEYPKNAAILPNQIAAQR